MLLKNGSLSILKITVAGLGLLLSQLAVAACVEAPSDVWECTDTNTGDVLTGATDDTVTVFSGATVNGDLRTQGGADSVTNYGTVNGILAGGDGADTVTNHGTVNGTLASGDGADTVTNHETVNGDLTTDGGADTVTNYGTVTGDIVLGNGSDWLRNRGVVGGLIGAGDETDTIEHGGSATGGIFSRLGDDVIILINGAVSTSINGGPDTDTLIFQFTGLSPSDIQAIDAAIAGNPASGSVTVAGQTYNWVNMELLVNNSTLRPPTQVPTLSELALILLGLMLGVLALFRHPARLSV